MLNWRRSTVCKGKIRTVAIFWGSNFRNAHTLQGENPAKPTAGIRISYVANYPRCLRFEISSTWGGHVEFYERPLSSRESSRRGIVHLGFQWQVKLELELIPVVDRFFGKPSYNWMPTNQSDVSESCEHPLKSFLTSLFTAWDSPKWTNSGQRL